MIGTDWRIAADLLTKGKLVAIPTETVYGLAADATNIEAVLSIFKAKNRPFFDPLIVHIHNYDQLDVLTSSFPDKAKILAEAFWPGPLTLILPKSNAVPDMVTSGLNFVGIRMPRHPLTRTLLQNIPFPLAAPSANPFGYVSPTTAQHVEDQLGGVVDYILDGGIASVGVESTIISFAEEGNPTLLRYGGITLEQIQEIIGPVKIQISGGSKPDAPGQLDKHYATKKPIRLIEYGQKFERDKMRHSFLIGFGKIDTEVNFNLSLTADLEEATRNLFKALRLADESGFAEIVVSKVPATGLGMAINDRLNRAAFH